MPQLRYAALRLLVLLASFGLFWLVGMRSWAWLIVSVIVAAAVSYLLLRKQRDEAVDWLVVRGQERAGVENQVVGDDELSEDALLDAAEKGAADSAAAEAGAAEKGAADSAALEETSGPDGHAAPPEREAEGDTHR